jgi:hypothetical protein
VQRGNGFKHQDKSPSAIRLLPSAFIYSLSPMYP